MMYILFNDILQLQFFLTFSSLLYHKDARSEYGGLTIYDDTSKNYIWVKVFDDNVFAIIRKKKLGPRPDRSRLRVLFKISDEHPNHLHMQSSPPGASSVTHIM